MSPYKILKAFQKADKLLSEYSNAYNFTYKMHLLMHIFLGVSL